jgi:hypothetical protein
MWQRSNEMQRLDFLKRILNIEGLAIAEENPHMTV